MLKIVLNRLKPQAEIIAEEQQASEKEEAPQSRSSTYESSVRNLNLRFADDIDSFAGEEEELQN